MLRNSRGQANSHDNDSFSSSPLAPTSSQTYPSMDSDEFGNNSALNRRNRRNRNEDGEYGNDYENGEDNTPFFSYVNRYGRLALAAVGGFIEGLIEAPFVAFMELGNNHYDMSTFGLIFEASLTALVRLFTHPFYVADRWLKKESADLHHAHFSIPEASAFNEDSDSIALYYAYGVTGFILGCLKAPFAGLRALFTAPQRNEGLIETLLRAPFRFLAALFSAPFDTAKDWAEASTENYLGSRGNSYSERDTRDLEGDGEQDNLIRSLVTSLNGLAGFFYGLLEAPFAAFNKAINPPANEAFYLSVLKAPYRFLVQLLKTPFALADASANDQEIDLMKDHRSLVDYLRITAKYFGGFITGCLVAPMNAIEAILFKTKNENLLTKLVFAPFRFLQALITSPFQSALQWANDEKSALQPSRSSIIHHNTEGLEINPSDFGVYLASGLKGFVGLLVSVVVAPLAALLNVFGLDNRSHPNDSLVSSVVKAPFVFLEKTYEAAVDIITWFATPSDDFHDEDDCEDDHGHTQQRGQAGQMPRGGNNNSSSHDYSYPRPDTQYDSHYGTGSSVMHSTATTTSTYNPNSQQPNSVSRLPRPGFNMTEAL